MRGMVFEWHFLSVFVPNEFPSEPLSGESPVKRAGSKKIKEIEDPTAAPDSAQNKILPNAAHLFLAFLSRASLATGVMRVGVWRVQASVANVAAHAS